MQKRAPWLAIPLATADDLIHVFESSAGPWPRPAAALDLALHLDASTSPFNPVPFPSQRALAARWRWPHGKVRGLLASVEEWADPAKHSANTALAQHSHSANTARKVEAVESSEGQHSANTALTHDSHSANTPTIPADIEKSAFEYGLSDGGTDLAPPCHLATLHLPHPNTYEAREPIAALTDEQPEEPPMPTDKPPRFCTRCPGVDHHKMSCTPHKSGDVAGDQPWPIQKPHADEVTDAIPAALCPASDDVRDGHNPAGSVRPGDGISTERTTPDRRAGQPVEPGQHVSQPGAVSGRSETPRVEADDPRWAAHHAAEVTDGQAAIPNARPAGLHRLPDAAGPVLPDAAPETAVEVGDASTLSPAPATTEPPQPPPSEMSVRVVAPRAETLLSLTAAPASKPKRGKAKQSDEQIAAIAAQVDRMMGRTGCALPGSGRWKQIVSAVNEAGAARVLARVTAMADAAQGLPSPAAAIFAAMAGSEYGTGPILRGHNGWTVKLDDALDAAQIGAKRPPDASGGATHSESRPAPQNAPQPRHSTNGATAWDDMLTTIRATGGLRLSIGLRGSTLSHDPAEHDRRCQAVRDIGGWPKLCEMGEGNRGIIRAQFAAAYDRLGVSA